MTTESLVIFIHDNTITTESICIEALVLKYRACMHDTVLTASLGLNPSYDGLTGLLVLTQPLASAQTKTASRIRAQRH